MKDVLRPGLSLLACVVAGVYSIDASAGLYDGPAIDLQPLATLAARLPARLPSGKSSGQEEAEKAAIQIAGKKGRRDGFSRGFSWGLYKAVTALENDPSEQAIGMAAVEGMEHLVTAAQSGMQQGGRLGRLQGEADAIGRFVSVLNTDRNVDPTVHLPSVTYLGDESPYQKFVGVSPTVTTILKKDFDTVEIPASEFWLEDGLYVFEQSKCLDAEAALQITMNQQPGNRDEEFSSAFKASYAAFAEYYYTREFLTQLDAGTSLGEQVGTQAGRRLAFYRGIEQGFNDRYNEVAGENFQKAFSKAYHDAFVRTFRDYLRNPKLSIRFDSVVSERGESVIRPGDSFSVRFTVKNIGGVASRLSATVSGDLEESSTQTFSIPKSKTMTFVARHIGRLNGRLRSGDKPKIVLNVNGILAEISEDIVNPLEIKNVWGRADYISGNGEVIVRVQNKSEQRTSGVLTATLIMNDTTITTQQIGFIEGKDTRDIRLGFLGADPLYLMYERYQARVLISMNDRPLDRVEYVFSPAQRNRALAVYFDALVNGKAYVPKTISRSARLAEIGQLIVNISGNEVVGRYRLKDENSWKTAPESTMVGLLVAAMRETRQSEATRDAYASLARQLWAQRTKFNRWGGVFKSGKRKAFEALCKQLAPTLDF